MKAEPVHFEPGFVGRCERFAQRLEALERRREGRGGASLLGSGEEWVGHRPYREGDDPRDLDWHLLARLDRPFVRVTRREASERWAVLLDTSASMGVCGGRSKLQAGAELAAAWSALGLRRRAQVRLVTSGAGRPRSRAFGQREGVRDVVGALEGARASGRAGLGPLLELPEVRSAGRVVAVGDLFDIEPSGFGVLLGGPRELLVACILAHGELEPDTRAPVVWRCPETGARHRSAAGPAVALSYETRLGARLEAFRTALFRHGARFGCYDARTAFEDASRDLLGLGPLHG